MPGISDTYEDIIQLLLGNFDNMILRATYSFKLGCQSQFLFIRLRELDDVGGNVEEEIDNSDHLAVKSRLPDRKLRRYVSNARFTSSKPESRINNQLITNYKQKIKKLQYLRKDRMWFSAEDFGVPP